MSETLGEAENLRNPLLERAMTIDKVRRGAGFAVIDLSKGEEDQIDLRGTFAAEPVRSDMAKGGLEALMYVSSAGKEVYTGHEILTSLDLAEMGVIQRSDGSWRPDTYTVAVEELCREL